MVDPRVVEAQLREGQFIGVGAGDRYLGDPDVVNRLIAGYCSEVETDLRQVIRGELTPRESEERYMERAKRYADIISGRDKDWQIVPGYHDVTIKGKFRADLRDFWPKVRHIADDDPHRVFFLWIGALIADAYKRWPSDDMEHMRTEFLRPFIRYAVKVLLGIEERAKRVG
ncbi:MAG TPA: hypothetical protein PKI22_08820 [Hydrogenophilus thermoluteolus]|nr:hypothetical protein [Hydrogenophilus thermoluteolus]